MKKKLKYKKYPIGGLTPVDTNLAPYSKEPVADPFATNPLLKGLYPYQNPIQSSTFVAPPNVDTTLKGQSYPTVGEVNYGKNYGNVKLSTTPQYPVGGTIPYPNQIIFENGGLKKVGQFAGNYARGLADIGLTTLGAGNVIQDSDYMGAGSKFASTSANIIGGVGAQILPMALNIAAPGTGTALKAVQGAASQFNPQPKVDQNGNPIMANGGQIGNDVIHAPELGGYFRKRSK